MPHKGRTAHAADSTHSIVLPTSVSVVVINFVFNTRDPRRVLMVWKRWSPEYPARPKPYQPVSESPHHKWKFCPDCHQRLEPGYAYCPECGKTVGTIQYRAERQIWCEKCHKRLDPKFKFCPHCRGALDRTILTLPLCECNAVILEGSTCCVACGKKLDRHTPQEENTS